MAYSFLDPPLVSSEDATTQTTQPMSPDAFVPLRVQAIRRVAPDLCEASLHIPQSDVRRFLASPAPPGVVCIYIKDDRMQVARAYTPINDWKDPQDPHVRFLFRVYPEGVVSPWLANKQPGDRLEVCGPTLTWTYQTNTHETIDMVSRVGSK